ncbi:hypothetical protein E5288_WYG010086 [Bos mutus]|uniref:Uncharacterized protein n=1 Tax=Bos mutus TaxID=72004 RepID=A0A6B0REV0_9CETA|nr:hypothetical protein [Bos mutus]
MSFSTLGLRSCPQSDLSLLSLVPISHVPLPALSLHTFSPSETYQSAIPKTTGRKMGMKRRLDTVSHIGLKIWIIGGCGKKATENLYPSGEWQDRLGIQLLHMAHLKTTSHVKQQLFQKPWLSGTAAPIYSHRKSPLPSSSFSFDHEMHVYNAKSAFWCCQLISVDGEQCFDSSSPA